MASQYFAILTDYGTRAIAHALSQGQPLQITQFAVGDGNGQAVTPTASATALVHQTHIAPVSAVSLDPRNNKQVIVELTIPENIGGFYIREMGVFDSQNKLIAYANCPESFKPTESSGSGKVQVLRMILKVESSSAVTLSIDHSVIFITRQQMAPKTITATTQNGFDESGHCHEIAKASTTQQGITQLYSGYESESEDMAATPKAIKGLKALIDAITRNLGDYIPNSKKSSAVNSNSADTVATSAAVKTSYDKAIAAEELANTKWTAKSATETEPGILPISHKTDGADKNKFASEYAVGEAAKKGLPLGAVVSFPRAVTNPVGFLRADGSTFNQQTFPDLYRVLGNSNQLPDVTRSDVGMTSYFAVDNIPAGWIAFDEIATQVTEQRYPELYRHLVGKYGSIDGVPKVADRFLRNAGNGLSVGQTQEDELKRHIHKVFSSEPSHRSASIEGLKNDNNLLDAGLVTAFSDNEWRDNGWMTPDVNSNFATGGDETRPKSLILKLCIKAINSFDDVVFWIKSHGEVTNAGALDAGRLAQGLQDKADRNHTHTASQITDFNQSVREIVTQSITQGFTQNLAETGWCKLPNGMILQWGKFNKGHGFVSNEQRLVTFPITFPNKVLFVGLTEFTNGWSYSTTVENRQRMTNSGFYVISQRNDSMYFALGF